MNSYSIRQDGVHVGVWTDYSSGEKVLTLPVRGAVYLVAATALFVTICGARFWSMQKFLIHNHLAGEVRTDALGLQHRVLMRNGGAEVGTIWEIGKMWWAWRQATPRARGRTRRTTLLALFPIVNVVGFALISVFSSRIAGKNYESSHVRLIPKNCGILLPNLGLNDTKDWQPYRFMVQTALNDTQAARQYAHACYQNTSNSGQCSTFPSQSVPYSSDVVDCPFGLTPAGRNLCQPNAGKALQLTTSSLDTNKIFGVNVPAENQIEVRKRLTCAPLQISEYIRTDNPGLDNATTYLELGSVPGVSAYTMLHKSQSKNDNIGYQLYSLPSVGGGVWSPVDALKVAHADVSITVLAGNSIAYVNPVKDPWFSASEYNNDLNGYTSDNELSVVACFDQYQLCNPSANGSSTCTILGSATDVFAAHFAIGLNKYQAVLATRMLYVLSATSIWQAVDAQGAGAILASRDVVALTSVGLPDNQWELEVRDWFTTSLATMQAAVVQYVNNLDQAALGAYASVATQNSQLTGVPEDYLCKAQRVRNTGSYVNFSFVWLIVILSVGIVLIPLSFALEPAQGWFKKCPSRRDVVRKADLVLQTLRVMLEAEGREGVTTWTRRMKDVPVTAGNKMFLLPELRADDGSGSRDFWPTRSESVEMMQSTAVEVVKDSGLAEAVTEAVDPEAGPKRDWLASITISERLEAQSLMSEVMNEYQQRSEGATSRRSSISALTDTIRS